jgi:hypothetical protein
VAECFAEDHREIFSIDAPQPRKRASAKKSDLLFQFKLTLLDLKPPVWRRIQVRDCTLADLHEVIQIAMGWENCHLHRFVVAGERFGPPAPDDLDLGVS